MLDYTPLKITLFSKDLSVRKFCSMMDYSVNNVWGYFNSKSHPSLSTLDKMTDILECEISDIVKWVPEIPAQDKVEVYRNELEMRFVSVPSELSMFIDLMVESYKRGLEDGSKDEILISE